MARTKSNISLPFAKHLRDIMQTRNLTAQDVADMAEVKRTVIHNWLLGSVPYDLYGVSRLAKQLKIPFYKLIFAEDENP